MNAIQCFDQAIASLQAGDLEQARIQFLEAGRLRPGDAAFQLRLAASLWTAHDFVAALSAFEQASRADQQAIAPCLLAAEKLFGLGRFRDCARWLEQATDRAPDDPAVRTMLGEVYDRANRLSRYFNSTSTPAASRCARRRMPKSPSRFIALPLTAGATTSPTWSRTGRSWLRSWPPLVTPECGSGLGGGTRESRLQPMLPCRRHLAALAGHHLETKAGGAGRSGAAPQTPRRRRRFPIP